MTAFSSSIDLRLFASYAVATAALLSTFILLWAGLRRSRAVRGSAAADGGKRFTPPVSILKPLCGVDEALYENLVSFARLDYPAFELVIALADADDPALAVVHRVQREFPDVKWRLSVRPSPDPSCNPKVANLLHALRIARHEYVLISDSNVEVSPDYLTRSVAPFEDPKVGLVSNLITARGEHSLAAQLENLHLNTFVFAGVCLADLAGKPCVIGKSMLMRRSELATLGGLESLQYVLAEDYVLGLRYHDAGFGVVLCTHPVVTRNTNMTLERFIGRHLRWAQLRRRVALLPFLSEPLLYSTPFFFAPLLVTHDSATLAAIAWALGLRVASDAWLGLRVTGRMPSPLGLGLLPFKDCLLLSIWLIALFRQRVVWRGRPLWIGAGSRLLPEAPRLSAAFRIVLTSK